MTQLQLQLFCEYLSWLLLLGVIWLTVLPVTHTLQAICKAHADGKFQIRAMTYTGAYFYLLSSEGYLFVEDGKTFQDNLKNDPPTIYLNKPADKLSPTWHAISEPVNYSDTSIQFGFIINYKKISGQTTVILRMIQYSEVVSGGYLKMCTYSGYQIQGSGPLSMIEGQAFCIAKITLREKPDFWLSDNKAMYPVQSVTEGDEMKLTIDATFYEIIVSTYNFVKGSSDVSVSGTFGVIKGTGKPQSGLFIEQVGMLIASEDSTVQIGKLTSSSKLMEQWPMNEFLQLKFCPKVSVLKDGPGKEDGPSNDAVKPTKRATNWKILYFALGGIVVIVLPFAVYAVYTNRMRKNAKRKSKKRDKGSKIFNFGSTISGLFDKKKKGKPEILPSKVRGSKLTSSVATTSTASPFSKIKVSKMRDKCSHFCGTIRALIAKLSSCALKRKEIRVSKVRESIVLASLAAATSNARQSSRRRKKGSKAGHPSRASPRSAVSGVLNDFQKGLLSFKALQFNPKPKLKPFSMASTASTASLASLASLPGETQSLDYHFSSKPR